jgi:hypothetical protein
MHAMQNRQHRIGSMTSPAPETIEREQGKL